MATKRIAYLGMLVALAFVLSYIESLIPISLGIPGAKIGLANLAVLIALYTIGIKNAFLISIVRIVLAGFTFGSVAGMLYSLAGGILSFGAMIVAKKTGKFTITGVSILGGVFHNLGQILMAMAVVKTASLIYYLPVLLIAGTLAGIGIGILGGLILKRVTKVMKLN